jgi:hypothetical protein
MNTGYFWKLVAVYVALSMEKVAAARFVKCRRPRHHH